jgi:pimeloyl-ACP methyl ester carboxylesterase
MKRLILALLTGAAFAASSPAYAAVKTIVLVHGAFGPVGDGFLAVNPDAFSNDFAADAPKPVARFMAISQVPVAAEAFDAKATVAAWKQKPSYAVIPKQDRMINPDLERFMAKRAQSQVIELPGSHAIFLSHAVEVAALIEKAATAAK